MLIENKEKQGDKTMKFVHIADMHFDVPFTTLSRNDLGNKRRLEQRKVFSRK